MVILSVVAVTQFRCGVKNSHCQRRACASVCLKERGEERERETRQQKSLYPVISRSSPLRSFRSTGGAGSIWLTVSRVYQLDSSCLCVQALREKRTPAGTWVRKGVGGVCSELF